MCRPLFSSPALLFVGVRLALMSGLYCYLGWPSVCSCGWNYLANLAWGPSSSSVPNRRRRLCLMWTDGQQTACRVCANYKTWTGRLGRSARRAPSESNPLCWFLFLFLLSQRRFQISSPMFACLRAPILCNPLVAVAFMLLWGCDNIKLQCKLCLKLWASPSSQSLSLPVGGSWQSKHYYLSSFLSSCSKTLFFPIWDLVWRGLGALTVSLELYKSSLTSAEVPISLHLLGCMSYPTIPYYTLIR